MNLLSLFCHHYGIATSLPKDALLQQVLRYFSAIPYENLSKIITAEDELTSHVFQTPEDLLLSHWRHGTGGTCFPLTQTLLQLVTEMGFEAGAILADRRYGTDTHCALVLWIDGAEHILDPGYLLFNPVTLPQTSQSKEHQTPFSTLLFSRAPESNSVDLATIEKGRVRYRLTYKMTPVDDHTFKAAWRRSFDWEMMTYPVISKVVGDSQVYIQKKSLTIRSKHSSDRRVLSQEELSAELSLKLYISQEVVTKALGALKYRS